jgi:hypothetical protein
MSITMVFQNIFLIRKVLVSCKKIKTLRPTSLCNQYLEVFDAASVTGQLSKIDQLRMLVSRVSFSGGDRKKGFIFLLTTI